MRARTVGLLFVAMAMLTALLSPTGGYAADAVDLLPPENLAGWTRVPIPAVAASGPKQQWRVDKNAGTLVCGGDGGHEWLRYDTPLEDFVLSVDWRFTPREGADVRYNSGIGVSLSKYGELWVQAQAGSSGAYLFGDNIVDGVLDRFTFRGDVKAFNLNPAGEWNHYEIRVERDTVTFMANGKLINRTAGIVLRRRFIGFEAEGSEITFKNIRLQTL
jgi:hypothetical protein